MAKVKWEVVAVTGKYKTADGTEKSRFAQIGVALETERGLRLKLETMPVTWDGFALLSEPKAKAGTTAKPATKNTFDDEWQP